jgi:cellulose synthase/poly-beta-1,6-N-acetylglucosamine synthase-like glycosyltransferase
MEQMTPMALMLLTIARAFLLVCEITLAIPLLYLVTLALGATIASLRKTSASHKPVSSQAALVTRFAILVPAHNEELLIGNTLASLAQLDYPADAYAVHIIADNCTDRTAEIAHAAGAYVHERTDTTKRGKGHALAWAIDRLMQGQTHYDAYIILDSDTVVAPSLLRAFAQGIACGGKALQAHNAVLNATESATTALRWLALSLMNYVRPLGRNSLGGSSTLTGNGMCLTHELLLRHPWRAFGLSEDYQYYLTLVADGERVLFVPAANVRSVMPTTARQLQSQDIRWETLNPDASSWQRHMAWHLFVDGIRKRNWVRLDALAELLTPPLSVLAGGCALLLVAALALTAPLQLLLAALLAGALLMYVCSAFALLRPPLGVYRALLHAPAYIVRKLWIYFVLRRLRKHTNAWVRTARTASASGENQP